MLSPPTKIARAGVMVAVSVALGWLTITIPNVELMTAAIFVSGYWCGATWGMLVGLVAEALFSITNPVGIPLPPLLIAQCLGMAIVGLAGGWMHLQWRSGKPRYYQLMLGSIGLVITIIYDILTTLSFPLASGFYLSQIWKVLIMGIPFVAIHWMSNLAIFVLIVPLILKRLPFDNSRVPAAIILLLLLFSISPSYSQDIEPPPESDTLKIIAPDSLLADSIKVDALEVDTIGVDTLQESEAMLDTLPTVERIFAPMPQEDPINFALYFDRAGILEPEVEDVSDVVRYFPDTYPFDMATFGAYSGVSIDGQTPRRSEYVLDGRSLNERRNGMVDLNEITPEEIEQLSDEPHPSWSEPAATGGTIGFRSYLPMADVPFSRIDVRAGYYGFTTVDYHVAQKLYKNWYTNLVGQVGYFGERGPNTDAESVHFRGHITHKPTPLWSGRLSYYHYRSKNTIPYPASHHKTVRNDLILSVARRLHPNSESRLELQTWVTDIRHNDQNILREIEQRVGSDLRIIAPVCSIGSIWAGVFGEAWEIQSDNDPSKDDREFRFTGGAEVPIASIVDFQTSALMSLYSSGISEPAGSASLSFRPEHWIRLRGTGEWTFRAPSYFEQFGHGRLDIREDLVEPFLLYSHLDTLIAAMELDPERSQTFSGAMDLLLPWSLRLTFGVYRKELTNPILFHEIEDIYVQAFNGERTKWQGGYIAGQWAIWDSLELAGRLSFDDAIDDPSHYVPDESGWGTITYRRTLFHGDLRLIGRVEGLYWGERILTRNLRIDTAPRASVINFRISATIRDFTIFWGMNNVYSEKYQLLGGFPLIHREEIYGVRWNFLD
jgi:hypothetical protein